MKSTILLHIFLFIVLRSAVLLAQSNNSKKTVIEKSAKKETIKENSTGNIKTPQSTGDEIKFKNETDNSILTITDEGDNAASITLPPLSAIGLSSSKLYNLNGSLYWNGNALGFANGWTKSGNYVYLTDPANFVGIGTSSPAYNLDIRSSSVSSSVSLNLSNSDASHNLFFYSGKDGNPSPLISWRDGDDLRFAKYSSGTTELMRIMSNGNVGIGTNNPGAKLEVEGQVKITGGAPGDGKVLVSDANGLASWNTFGINDLSDAKYDGSSLFLGEEAGINDDGGNTNTAVGYQTLYFNTSGAGNTANGYHALYSNTIGGGNTANGVGALYLNTFGIVNTACGSNALNSNGSGNFNTAIGSAALSTNTSGEYNTAIGNGADVSSGGLTNATAVGNGAVVDASNKIRLGNDNVTVIEGKVDFTFTSDSTKKENFLKVNGEKVLEKFSNFRLTSWNYKGGNPATQRHYGIMAQDFFSAVGHDAIGTIGNDTTLTGSDVAGINMIAIQALEKRTTEQDQRIKTQEKRIEELEKRNKEIRMQNAELRKQDTQIKIQDEEIKNLNTEIKNEFEYIKLIVNKLANKQEKMDITYK